MQVIYEVVSILGGNSRFANYKGAWVFPAIKSWDESECEEMEKQVSLYWYAWEVICGIPLVVVWMDEKENCYQLYLMASRLNGLGSRQTL